MIKKISLNNVASYKNETDLDTDKKINLIYGLNGTGKSTLSNYLYSPQIDSYKDCYIVGLDETKECLVYNQKFINENFYLTDELQGVFTLSKINTDAEYKIKIAHENVKKIENNISDIEREIESIQEAIDSNTEDIKDSIWEIKTDYTGGDRVFEYCFNGIKRKDPLFNHLINITKTKEKPKYIIEDIKREIISVQGDSAQSYPDIHLITFNDLGIESDEIFQKEIVGNKNSSVSDLIEKLGNSDWVKEGLLFINDSLEMQMCPFCQKQTVDNKLIKNIQNFFDKTYEEDMNKILDFRNKYLDLIDSIMNWEYFENHPFPGIDKYNLKLKYENLTSILKNNLERINQKLKTPSNIIHLEASNEKIKDYNNDLKNANDKIKEHNDKFENKGKTLEDNYTKFWNLQKWNYDSEIIDYKKKENKYKELLSIKENEKNKFKSEIKKQNNIIIAEQKKTINIEEAVLNIKSGLVDLGIDSFTIENHKDNKYRITRGLYSDNTFHSLSEGEKMIISFLYFIELCKGKIDTESTKTKKIIVIDDPISSLSHIYVFNISQIIKRYFSNTKSIFEQVFILTHSLYFFYELTFIRKEDRDEHQKLFRIIKNENGSKILPMKYSEVQNDYQSYWAVIKDKDHSPALIANCMRNIIEYFFSFTEKIELNNVFNKPILQDVKYQAFYRYINRESHSIGQNIFDIKEFDYTTFLEAFKLVFTESGYHNHYKRMMK